MVFAKANSCTKMQRKGGSAVFFLRFIALAFVLCGVLRAQPTSPAQALSARALDAGLAHHATWAALLHVANGKPHITGADFLLSGAAFSLQNELAATLALFYGPSAAPAAVCRFPARYLWLRSQLTLPELPIGACAELAQAS
jgi:hypothetical protein